MKNEKKDTVDVNELMTRRPHGFIRGSRVHGDKRKPSRKRAKQDLKRELSY
jgi:hypothetical protein